MLTLLKKKKKVEKPLNYSSYLCSELVILRLEPSGPRLLLPRMCRPSPHEPGRHGKAPGAGPERVPCSLSVHRPCRGPEILTTMVVPSWVGVGQLCHQDSEQAAWALWDGFSYSRGQWQLDSGHWLSLSHRSIAHLIQVAAEWVGARSLPPLPLTAV